MLTKNQFIDLECTALGASFEGICRHEGQVVFVQGALPGEMIRARIIKVTKQYAVGRLEALLSVSPERAEPPCPYYPRCGGCNAQHLSYEATLRHKRRQVADCLERIGGIDAPEVADTLGMEAPWRYRNKGAFPVEEAEGRLLIGMYAARSHSIVDAPAGCLLQSAGSDALVAAVRRWMAEYGIKPYREQAHDGLIRHIMTREAAGGEMMLVLVANGPRIPQAQALIDLAQEAVPMLRSVILCENTQRTNVILTDRLRTLWGEDTLTDTLAGFEMRVSPRSFFQVNRPQAERLYARALEEARLTGGERVWDIYCGAGSITLPLARQAAHVTGVEIVEDAVADARVNARLGGVDNVDFLSGAAEDILPALAKEQGRPDVVVLDPPRKGCEMQVLDAVAAAAPGRIVYVSCNPATLARDVKTLVSRGYTFIGAQPVDMFGWTGHVEAVVSLSRKAGDACGR